MSITVRIPSQLRSLTNGAAEIEVVGSNVREAIAQVNASYSGIGDRILDDGQIRRFVNVFVEDEDVRFLSGLDTSVQDGQTISIVPAVAGGWQAHAGAQKGEPDQHRLAQ